jgi:hypothetical protein
LTPTQIHHARIMVECGCSIEDVAVTLRVRLHEAIYAVAPSLKANAKEAKRVRTMLQNMKLPPAIPVIHRRTEPLHIVNLDADDARNAA